jgi:hypothetical protein
MGFPERLIATIQETRKLDPLSIVDLDNLADVLNADARYAEAAAAASAALSLQANRPLALYNLCWTDTATARFREANILIARLSAMQERAAADGCRVRLAAAEGRLAEARAISSRVATELQGFVFDETDVTTFFAMSNDIPEAMSWARRAFERRNANLFATQYWRVTPPLLLNSPGWQALLQRPETRAWRQVHDRIASEFAGR